MLATQGTEVATTSARTVKWGNPMLLVLANNMTMVAGPGQVAMVTTDAIPLNGNDRLDAMINVHTIFNTTAPGFAFALEVSTDGRPSRRSSRRLPSFPSSVARHPLVHWAALEACFHQTHQPLPPTSRR